MTIYNFTTSPPGIQPSTTLGEPSLAAKVRPLGSRGLATMGTQQFDIFEWHSAYQRCQRFFLDHAQHENGVQAVAALIDICLPSQWTASPIMSSIGPLLHSGCAPYNLPWPMTIMDSNSRGQPAAVWVSLFPYVQRLVITGMDKEGIMHGFFGDDWRKGVGPIHECERRNYLFAAKSVGWAKTKCQYDMSPHESVPLLESLLDVRPAEIESAEVTGASGWPWRAGW